MATADTPRVKFELAHPTQGQLRDGVICGLIAQSVLLPILITVMIADHRAIRWAYLGGAIACIFTSVVTLALFVAITKGRASVNAQANVWFVILCLGISAVGLLELTSSAKHDLYTPAVLVGVAFGCIIGDRRMQLVTALYAVVLITLISWAEGARGAGLVSVVVVYASTVAAITLICARTVGSLAEHVNFRQAVDKLNESFDEIGASGTNAKPDTIYEVFRRGLPLVTGIMPADRVGVFTRRATSERFTPLVTWPDEHEEASDLASLPELAQAVDSSSVVVRGRHCVIPVGYAVGGELVMVVYRSDPPGRTDHRALEAAELLSSSFLRVTSRVNFVCGLQAESRTDPLTGLANRRNLFERIEIEMARALRSETPLSLAMIDLDHFKYYNDCYGHVAGDTLLRSIAAVMVSNIRGQDLVARYGGEEFCLVMPDTDLVGGHHLLDTLRAGGREATSELGVTLSAGLTSWDGYEDMTSFIERADQALYRAKEKGCNRVVSIQTFTEF